MSSLLVAIFVLYLGHASAKHLAPIFENCTQDSPEISKCFREAIEQLRPQLGKGIPELLIPPLDPLVLPEASVDGGQQFKAKFKNIKLYHALEFVLENTVVDLEHDHVELQILFPRLRLTSDYNVNGNILAFTVNGQGPADGNLTNVRAYLTADGARYTGKDGKEHWKARTRTLKMDLGKPVLKFDNLFRKNRELNERANQVLNENIEELIEELRPILTDTVSQVIYGITDRIFEKFPIDGLFPPKQ